MRLENMVALVTGGTRGLGEAMARSFAAEGAQVVITGRTADEGERIAAGIGPAATFIACDVGDAEQVAALVEAVDARFGRVDVLVNNAAQSAMGSVLDLPLEALETTLAVSLKAPFQLTQLVGRIMVREQRGGSIINISSVQQAVGGPRLSAYCMAKAGLHGLTMVSAIDLGPYGIRVNTIAPGTFVTRMHLDGTTPEIRAELKKSAVIGRLGEVDELAEVAVFFASRESSYVTGQVLFVDGGRLTLNPALRPDAPQPWLNFRR